MPIGVARRWPAAAATTVRLPADVPQATRYEHAMKSPSLTAVRPIFAR